MTDSIVVAIVLLWMCVCILATTPQGKQTARVGTVAMMVTLLLCVSYNVFFKDDPKPAKIEIIVQQPGERA